MKKNDARKQRARQRRADRLQCDAEELLQMSKEAEYEGHFAASRQLYREAMKYAKRAYSLVPSNRRLWAIID